MKGPRRMGILGVTLLFAQVLVAQSSAIRIFALINSGEEAPSIDITSADDIADLRNLLADLAPAPPPQWCALGWKGFLLENHGVSSFPAQVTVLFGVIEVIQQQTSTKQFFLDSEGLEERIFQLFFPPNASTPTTVPMFVLPPDISEIGHSRGASKNIRLVPEHPFGMPTNGSEPPYIPELWNKPSDSETGPGQDVNNCYNYVCDKILDHPATPGAASGRDPEGQPFTCNTFTYAATGDGLVKHNCDTVCPRGTFKVALVLDRKAHDFHWYQQNAGGNWSHKPGLGEATNLDSSGNVITDPRTADRRAQTRVRSILRPGYDLFCDCFCVDPKEVKIK